MSGCRGHRQRLLRAPDGDLPLEERLQLEAHLAECAACRAEHAAVQRLQELLERAPEPPLHPLDPCAAQARIRAALDGSTHDLPEPLLRGGPAAGAPHRRRVAVLALALTGAAAAALLLGLAPRTPRGAGTPSLAQVPDPDVPSADPEPRAEPPAPAVVRAAPPPVAPPAGSTDATPGRPRVEDWLRASLRSAFGDAERDGAEALAAFEAAADPAFLRWPLVRLAEGYLVEDDLELARAATRFLGLRGDRITASVLGGALGRRELAPAALAALGQLGPPATGALVDALDDPLLREEALERLAVIGGPQAAQGIDASLRELLDRVPEPDAELVQAHVRALARTGPHALRILLRLAADERLARGDVLDCLPVVPEGGRALADDLERTRPGADVELLLAAAARLQPSAALPWIAERATQSHHRRAALACLERWDGLAPLDVLLDLEERGSVPGDALARTLSACATRDGARLEAYARELVGARDPLRARRFLELLIESAHPAAAEALATIALADLLTEDDRQWAALAVGELAGEAGARRLVHGLPVLGGGERRLFAACLLSIHRRLGAAGVGDALAPFPPAAVARLQDTLAEVPSAPSSVLVFRIARQLGDTLFSRGATLAATSP